MDIGELRTRLQRARLQPARLQRDRLAVRDGTLPQTHPDRMALAIDNADAEGLTDRALIPAAVLVPIVYGADAGVLLTKRTTTLSSHAGQVAFPGGHIDPGEDAEQAALREAMEEVGLPANLVEVTGLLSDHVTGSGFCITPVIGLLAPGFTPVPAAAEVEEVFTLPLRTLLDPHAPQRQRASWKGRRREFWVWPHTQHYIWGVTAAILVQLAQRLRAAGAA